MLTMFNLENRHRVTSFILGALTRASSGHGGFFGGGGASANDELGLPV